MPKTEPPPLTVAQASRDSGIPRRTIQQALTLGNLKAQKLPGLTGAWVIDRADFARWMADRRATCTRCGGRSA